MGRWFDVVTSNTDQRETKCSTGLYSRNDNGGFTVAQTAKKKNGDRINDKGKAKPTSYPGVFKISFQNSFFKDIFNGHYEIIDTDYVNFAIIYSCSNYLTFRRQHVWILLRSLENSHDAIREYTNYIDRKLNLKKFDFFVIDNSRESCGSFN